MREFWGCEMQGGWPVPMPLCPHIPLPVVTPHLLAPTLGLWGPSCPVPQFPSTTGHFCPHRAFPRRPWHTQAPGQACAGAGWAGKPMSPRGGHQPRRATRNTSCIDRGAAIQRGEALPGGSLSHRCPPHPVPHGGTPLTPPETDSISMDTEHHEGREGAGWERAAGSGGERLGGRGGA